MFLGHILLLFKLLNSNALNKLKNIVLFHKMYNKVCLLSITQGLRYPYAISKLCILIEVCIRQDKTKHCILSVHKYGNMRNDKYRYTKEADMCNDNMVLTFSNIMQLLD